MYIHRTLIAHVIDVLMVCHQFEIEDFLRIEQLIGQHSELKRLPVYPVNKEAALRRSTQVAEAEKLARLVSHLGCRTDDARGWAGDRRGWGGDR